MEWNYRGSFLRDWEKINSRLLTRALQKKFKEIERAGSPGNIAHLKKLRSYETRYKIEIALSPQKIYWVLCIVSRNKIELVRLKPEKYFKKTM